MNLADVKLRIRQLTDIYKGKHAPFDSFIETAIRALNKAIVESTEVVSHPDGSTALRSPRVSGSWLDRQEQKRIRSRAAYQAKKSHLLERAEHE
jgi:hypothetical protein